MLRHGIDEYTLLSTAGQQKGIQGVKGMLL